MQCPITGDPMRKIFSHTILNKYEVDYFYSEQSKIIQTEKPYWLAEAYQEAIVQSDVGLVARNIGNRDKTALALNLTGLAGGPKVDLGGGYGLFTRLMRDIGYDFYTTDPYCKNIFATRHEAPAGLRATALTAFEVFEHIENPLAFVAENFEKYQCRTIIFSTLNYGPEIPGLDWWYWVFHGGQHITFYNTTTLDTLAEKLGCRYYGLDSGFHIITDKSMSFPRRLALRHRWARSCYKTCTKRLNRRPGLLESDFQKIVSHIVKQP